MSSPYNEFLNEKLGLKSDKAAKAFYWRIEHIRLLSGKEKVLEILNKTEPEPLEWFLDIGGGKLILEWLEIALKENSALDHEKSSIRENTALILSFIKLFIKCSMSWLEEFLPLDKSIAIFFLDEEQAPQLVKEFLKKRLNLLQKTAENRTTNPQRVDQSKSLSPKRKIGRLVITSEDNHLAVKRSTASIGRVIESTHGSDDDCILIPNDTETNLGNVPAKIKKKRIKNSVKAQNKSNYFDSEIEMPEIRQISGNEIALNIAYSTSRAGKNLASSHATEPQPSTSRSGENPSSFHATEPQPSTTRSGENPASFHAPRSQPNCFQGSGSSSSDNSNPKSLDYQKLFNQSMSSSDDAILEDQSFLVSKIAYYCYRLGSLGKNG
ncbi:uncharacterized protein LOC141850676 [Brevipalpus obovatus]|uniref:uncharacterized protein LOC141850676 n=1 Tax=Brevipalpus obovatus TaxID=246614 RepID=UPI003D9F5439